MFEQAGFGAGHAFDGAAEHGLNRGVGGCPVGVEGGFDGVDVCYVWFVRGHPTADAGVEFVEVFDDEGSASIFAVGADTIEGKDECVAELADMTDEPEGGGVRKVGASDEFRGDRCGA